MSTRTKPLNNEEQIRLLNAVKEGRMTIDEAVNMNSGMAQGGKATEMQGVYAVVTSASHRQKDGETSVYNFNIYKYNRFWQRQKRILQVDFPEKVLCNISKGAVRKRFPFAELASCEGQEGLRLTLYFTQHHEYELEVTSDFDKTQILRLAHLILNQNKALCQEQEETLPGATAPQSLRVVKEGEALLRKGGLASVKWIRVWLELSRSELRFYPSKRRQGNPGKLAALTGEALPDASVAPCIVHLSTPGVEAYADGLADSFCVSTNKNLYTFHLALNNTNRDDFTEERDHWVREIESVCRGYERLSQSPSNAFGTDTVSGAATTATSATSAGIAAAPAATAASTATRGEGPGSQAAPEEPVHDNSSADSDPGPATPEAPLPDPAAPVADQTAGAPGVASNAAALATEATTDARDRGRHAGGDEPDSALFSCIRPREQREAPAVAATRAAPPAPPSLWKQPTVVAARTKALHWDPVQSDRIAKSVWAQTSGDAGALDQVRLHDAFRLETSQAPVVPAAQQQTPQILLNSKVAQNFCIFLRGFRFQPAQLREQLLVLRGDLDTGITDEQIAELRRYVPTAEDVDMYKPHMKRRAKLHQVDQYMLEMCNIPLLGERLELLLIVREFPGQISELKPLIAHQLLVCSQLAVSKKFVSVLEYVLLIGNSLNETAGRTPIKGFSLSSLPKLMETRGQNKKYTLLTFLVDQIKVHRPELLDFPQELQSLKSGSTASIKGLTAEMDVLRQSQAKLIKYYSSLKKPLKTESEVKFLAELKALINKFKGELDNVTTQINELRKSYAALMVKFGETADRDSETFFGWITQFMDAFTTTLRSGTSGERGRHLPF